MPARVRGPARRRGLARSRPARAAASRSTRFDLGAVAWIVLTTSPEAGSFGMPGVAQQLVDALPPERLAHLGLGALPRASGGGAAWGGPRTDFLVDDGSPYLVEVARAIAPILSRPGHEVDVAPMPRGEIAKRRGRGALLALDVVRPVGPDPANALVALASADDPARAIDVARHPPKLAANASARSLTATLRLGVVGELRIAGG